MKGLVTKAAILLAYTAANDAKVEDEFDHAEFLLSTAYFEDIAVKHNEAFNQLGEMYADRKPIDRTEMMDDIHNIISSYCGNDLECRYNAQDRSLHSDLWTNAEQNIETPIDYPDDFDDELIQAIDRIFPALKGLASDNNDGSIDRLKVDQVVETLNALRTEVTDKFMSVDTDAADFGDTVSYRTNPAYVMATVTGISVAIESTKLWTNIYSNSSHPLYKFHDKSYFEAAVDKNEDDKSYINNSARDSTGRRAQSSTDLVDWKMGGDDDDDDDHPIGDGKDDDVNDYFDDDHQSILDCLFENDNVADLLADLIRLAGMLTWGVFTNLVLPATIWVIRVVLSDTFGAILGVLKYVFRNSQVFFTNSSLFISSISEAGFNGGVIGSASYLIPVFGGSLDDDQYNDGPTASPTRF